MISLLKQSDLSQRRYLKDKIAALILIILLPWSATSATALEPQQSPKSELLKFTSGGHVLGFQPDGVYIASGDHMFKVGFADTPGVNPVVTGTTGGQSKAQPLSKVTYPDLWPGINLSYEAAKDGIIESTWRIAPGADPEQIRLNYNAPVTIEASGSVKIRYATGWMRESAPIAWQVKDKQRIAVQVAFRSTESTNSETSIGFELGQYDATLPLMIDPVLEWSTFAGSAKADSSWGITTDSDRNVYITGRSTNNWGTPIQAHTSGENDDAFVAKFNSDGILQWNTFMGSSGEDYGFGIALDAAGDIYVTGISTAYWGWSSTTPHWGFPINGYTGSSDAFVAKFNSAGVYQWHTFMGSATALDEGNGIALDGTGNIFVTGNSAADWGSPLTLNHHTGDGVFDGFIAKLNSTGARQWITFIGAAGVDTGKAISIDNTGDVYVVGASLNSWGAPEVDHAGPGIDMDAYAAKFDTSGVRQWNTFLGSSGYDYGYGSTVDNHGNLFVIGESDSDWGEPLNPGSGAILAKFNTTTGTRYWHTFLGAGSRGRAVTTLEDRSIFVTGLSSTSWGSPRTPHSGGLHDAFVAKLAPTGSLDWNTFMGSATYYDYGNAIALDNAGDIFVTGYSNGTWGYPLNTYAGSNEVFVAKVNGICATPPSGLTNWWGGDGNTADIAGSADGTFIGAVAYDEGEVNQAISFDGLGGYFEVSDSSVGDFGAEPFTVDFWMNTLSDGSNAYIMGKSHPDSGADHGWDIRLNNRQIQVVGVNNWGFNIETTQVITVGAWHHVAVTSDGSTTEVYIDGVFRGSSGRSTITTAPNPFRMGFTTNFGGTAFNGLIDEVEISNRALSQTEIQAIVNAGSAGKCRSCAAQPAGMVAWWQGEGNANDFTGTNNGTLMNSTGYTAGMVGQAFDFEDSTNDYIEVPHSASLDITGAYSAEGWVRFDTQAQTSVFAKMDANGTPSSASYTMATEATGQIGGGLYGSDPADYYLSADSQIETGVWRHIAITWDGTTTNANNVSLYLDGRLIESWTKNSAMNSTMQSLTLGATKPTLYARKLDGQIDELTIYNTELTAAEIASIANARTMGKCGAYHTVSTSAPASEGSFTPTSQTVSHGDTASFTVMPNSGYTVNAVSGCSGSWSGNPYVTGSVTADCTVTATFNINSYIVSATVDAHGDLDSTSNVVNHDSTTSFTISPAIDYTTDVDVGGDCPGGSWAGQTYTTGAITSACNVSFTHTIKSYLVGTSATEMEGSIAPPTQMVNHGSTASLNVTANTGYTIFDVTGCGDNWSGANPYVTDSVTSPCTVMATFTHNSYTVSTSAPAGEGTITPPSGTITHGNTLDFTVTAEPGFSVNTVTGCGGTWTGANPYTTGQVTADCTVTATFRGNDDCTFFVIPLKNGSVIAPCL